MTLYERDLIQIFHDLPYISNFTKPVEATMTYLEPTKKYHASVWNSLQSFSKTWCLGPVVWLVFVAEYFEILGKVVKQPDSFFTNSHLSQSI